jgi:hypothetical protein
MSTQDDTEGTILIYRPSDHRKDITIPLNINDSGYQFIDRSGLLGGKYIIKIDWESDNKAYYFEETFINN